MIIWFDFLNIFLLGLLASLQPCLFPVLPTFLAFITKSEYNRKSGILAGVLVSLGIITVFLGIVLVFQAVEIFFLRNYELFRTSQGIILMIFGALILLGLNINNQYIDRISSFSDSLLHKFENPWVASYMIGFLFTLLAAPCAIIIFSTAIVYITSFNLINSIILIILFSISASLPFILVGGVIPSFKETLIENRKRIEKGVSILAGSLIILTGLYLTIDGLGYSIF